MFDTLKDVQDYIDHDNEMSLDNYLNHLSELHYQAVLYNDKLKPTYYGDNFRKYNLTTKLLKMY